MTEKRCARALEFAEQAVYYPTIRPGYAAWASLFPFGNGDLGIAFNEIRPGENLLMEHHVVDQDEEGVYHWYRSVHSGQEGEP